MPLVDMGDMLRHAHSSGYAVGAFEAPNPDCVEAVIAAAENCRSPVVLSLSEARLVADALACRMALIESAARCAEVPVAIHLNHAAGHLSAVRAIRLGCNSVMAHAAGRSFPDQVAESRLVADMAHGCGVNVEGDIGCLLGGELPLDEGGKASGEVAIAYARRTGIDCLATFVGITAPHAHGRTRLDTDLLKRVGDAVGVPFTLHTQVDLTDAQYHKLILHGVAAIHGSPSFGTVAARSMLANLERTQSENPRIESDPADHSLVAHVEHCMRLWGSAGRAAEVLMQCQTWQPVEHIVVHNVEAKDDAQIAALMAHGQEVLGNIPGVRQVFTGYSISGQAPYQYCWRVQFTHRKVIERYREHPDYVAFMNEFFRVLAHDRVCIEFAATPAIGPFVPATAPKAAIVQVGGAVASRS
jgi:fructose-bisphosphate aldolase, class II